MGLDEPGFPSGQGLPAEFDPGEYLIHLFSVGDDQFQTPEVKFLENSGECGDTGHFVHSTYEIFLGLVPQPPYLRSVRRRWRENTVS